MGILETVGAIPVGRLDIPVESAVHTAPSRTAMAENLNKCHNRSADESRVVGWLRLRKEARGVVGHG